VFWCPLFTKGQRRKVVEETGGWTSPSSFISEHVTHIRSESNKGRAVLFLHRELLEL